MSMSLVPTVKDNQISIQKFIDWDKFKNVFYNNFKSLTLKNTHFLFLMIKMS